MRLRSIAFARGPPSPRLTSLAVMRSGGNTTRSPRVSAHRASSSGRSEDGSLAASHAPPSGGDRRVSRPEKNSASSRWPRAHAGWPRPVGSSHARA
nr:hypothetical protein [Corallococcus sp. CA049B]